MFLICRRCLACALARACFGRAWPCFSSGVHPVNRRFHRAAWSTLRSIRAEFFWRRRRRLMPSVPLWFFGSPTWESIASLVESLLLATPRRSPLRSEILRVLAGAGLKAALDLSFLIDKGSQNLKSSNDVQAVVQGTGILCKSDWRGSDWRATPATYFATLWPCCIMPRR